MDCNKDEAVRAKEIAERKFSERDYAGAKKFALKALNLYPSLEGLSQFLTTLDVYISAENKVSGEMDWYGILGVDPFADEETIKKQYKNLVLTLHPDKNKSLGGEGAFQLVKEAWGLLSDKAKRLAYNQNRSLKGLQHKTPNYVGSQSEAPSANGFSKVTKNVTSNVRSGSSNNVRAGPTLVPPPHKKAETFWTVCNRCKTHYEYLRIYLNHTLLCPNCNEPFLAIDRGPPPNVLKSSNWCSDRQHKNSQHYAGSSNTYNPGGNSSFQWGPHSRMASSSSVAGQGSAVVHPASEKVRRERDGAPSIAEWQRSQMSQGSDGSFHKVEKPSKMRRTGDMHVNGYQGYMTSHMTMGHGSAGPRSASELRMADSETERRYGKPYSMRELSMFEIRNMLVDKARSEIRKKLKEWRLVIEAKVTSKDKENKRQKSMLNDKGHQDGTSFSATSGETNRQKQAYVTITVPDSDFHNFDSDRTESSFCEDQVWAAYDNDDGMPRYYARIHKVISLNPFRMRISWLNSRSNNELAPIDWIGSGFYKTCGDFRTGRHEITDSLNSFSHKVRWTKGNRGVIRIFPGKGEVWALYRNWSPDWNQNTPDEVIHKYDMVEVLEDFSEEQGVLVAPLIKVAGFRVVFHRHLDPNQVRRIPKEEMFRFSHQVPYYLLTGREAHNCPKGCQELDPAATPLDLIELTEEASDKNPNLDTLPRSAETHITGMEEKASKTGKAIVGNEARQHCTCSRNIS